MNNLKKYLLPFLALGSLVSFAVGFRSFFMTNFIEPIAILCWAAWRIVSSVNQNIYWMILIVICSILMIRLIYSGKANLSNPAYNYRYMSPNRVEYWLILIKESILGRDETEYLRDNLKKLFVSACAQVERSDPTNLEERAAMGKVPLSLRARRFFGRLRVFY